jgi:hypothetical protein
MKKKVLEKNIRQNEKKLDQDFENLIKRYNKF